MRRGFYVALAVVAAANLAVLIGAARNRSGEREATVWLDERELGLLPAERESSVMQLRLRYEHEFDSDGSRTAYIGDALAPRFLDEARLRAVGFDCSRPVASPEAAFFYRTALQRPAYIVFEIGGRMWERQVADWQRREGEWIEGAIARGELTGDPAARARADVAEAPRRLSRLMPVDAGRDPAALRRTHPDRARFLILPAVVRLHFVDASEVGGPAIHGHLADVYPAILDVPRGVRAPLDALRQPASAAPRTGPSGRAFGPGYALLEHTPRYEVQVAVGRQFQPWVVQVRALP